jgi:hypothetical protein
MVGLIWSVFGMAHVGMIPACEVGAIMEAKAFLVLCISPNGLAGPRIQVLCLSKGAIWRGRCMGQALAQSGPSSHAGPDALGGWCQHKIAPACRHVELPDPDPQGGRLRRCQTRKHGARSHCAAADRHARTPAQRCCFTQGLGPKL